MEFYKGLPILYFESQAAWETWLEEHQADSQGLWLKISKKGSNFASVSYAQALEVAICYGWIDSQKGAMDDDFWLQRFTPRGPRSKWSKRNCMIADQMIRQGRMKAAGLREVELAKQDGRWEAAYASQSKITIPEDFQTELNKHPEAKEFFATLDSANRYAILYRLQTAKKPETRLRRMQKFITMLNERRTIH